MVRLATEKDIEQVNDLRRQVNELHVIGRPDVFKAGFDQNLQDFAYTLMNEENSDILVVERDGLICGMACVDYVRKTETPYTMERKFYHVQEIAVDEGFKRRGVGRELFEFMKEDAKRRKLNKIELDVWAFNESAIEFYEAMGFEETRIWMEYKL